MLFLFKENNAISFKFEILSENITYIKYTMQMKKKKSFCTKSYWRIQLYKEHVHLWLLYDKQWTAFK